MDILIVDFGSQSTHLISRRVRELGAETSITTPEQALTVIKNDRPKGVILSGGPASVYEKGAPSATKTLFESGIPILGICYGQQLIGHILGGKVKPGKKKEYVPATLSITHPSMLLKNVPTSFTVWMSHGDEVVEPPEGFTTNAFTETIECAAIANESKKIYGIQFHPEVVHTQFGEQILKNFFSISKLPIKKKKIDLPLVENLIHDISDSIGNGHAICALSGGVDSSVAALLVHKAIGKNLVTVYIDSGLMRKGETDNLKKVFLKQYHMPIKIIDAKKYFLHKLRGITNPEKKRTIIGKAFIELLEKEAHKTRAEFLVQGTIYPDVIESSGTKHSHKIKSHHNVAGLPKNMKLTLIEPLRTFYKDEVREIGSLLKIPKNITQRQPFPGPGLAIRIIGEVTERKLKILRKADFIVQEVVNSASLKIPLWQAFAIFTGIKTTGVRGDARFYGETVAIRLIEATDAMSAHWANVPYSILEKISSRIVTEVPEVNRVVYDITTKPPGTMEWE